MLQHVVVAKFKPETSQEEREEIVAALRALPGQIAEIRRFEVGLDVLHSERSYDFALVGVFDDLDALKRYQAHPDHVPLAQRLRAAVVSLIAVDYEPEAPRPRYDGIIQGVAEKLMEDERLRSNLADDEANFLLKWAIERVKGRVSSAPDEDTAHQTVQAEIARLHPAMVKINALLAGDKAPSVVSAIQVLGVSGAKSAISGTLDRKSFIQAMTSHLVEEWDKSA
jgi:hypothetical protein